MVAVKLGTIDVCARRDRTFQRIKRLLGFLAPDAFQPRKRSFLMRGSLCQGESIRHNDESRRICWITGMTHPAIIFFVLELGLYELPFSPIPHGAESHFALDELLDYLIPTHRRMIGIDVILHLGEKPHGFLHPWVIPLDCPPEKVVPILRAEHTKQCIFEQLRRSPNTRIANSKRDDSGLLEFIASREELVERQLITHFDSVLFQKFCVIPENVPAMDSGKYGVYLATLAHQVDDQFFRKGAVPSVALIQIGNRLAVTGIDVLAKQLIAWVSLPGIGRIPAGKPGLQHRSRS